MSIVLEADLRWGGFYIHWSESSKRICLGFVALTFHPFSIYDKIEELAND